MTAKDVMLGLAVWWLMVIVLAVGCNGHPRGEAVLSEDRIRSPVDKYLSVIDDDGGELAYVDAACRTHPGEALLKKQGLPCIRKSQECDSEAQRRVNMAMWAARLVKEAAGKNAKELCPEINKILKGG